MSIIPGLRVVVHTNKGDVAYPVVAATNVDRISLYVLVAGEIRDASSLDGYRGVIHPCEDIGTPHYKQNLAELAERLRENQ